MGSHAVSWECRVQHAELVIRKLLQFPNRYACVHVFTLYTIKMLPAVSVYDYRRA